MLLLSACSGSDPLDSVTPVTNPPTTPITVSQESVDQSPSEPTDIDIAVNGSEQSGTDDFDIPTVGAATPADNEPAVNSLGPDVIVTCDAPIEHIQQRTLQLINEARSQPRNCGTDAFEATTAMSWNTKLLQAADRHSADMTQHNFFNHTGSDSSTAGTRVDETGYDWRAVGENIAAGQLTAADVVSGWLSSPGHCRNLMNSAFTEVAVTCAQDSGTDYTRYCTNVLATSL